MRSLKQLPGQQNVTFAHRYSDIQDTLHITVPGPIMASGKQSLNYNLLSFFLQERCHHLTHIYVLVVPVCIWQLLDSRLGLTKIRIFFRRSRSGDHVNLRCFGDRPRSGDIKDSDL